jgi:aryl-alcohol dehydrogenase-like predicted oxidoreductase
MESKPKMQYRFLGGSGLKVSVIGYGNWLNSNKPENQKLTTDAIKLALDHGINFFDTAEAYGHGEAERQMGVSLKEINHPREDLVISTKIFWGQPGGKPNRVGLSMKRVNEGLRASL